VGGGKEGLADRQRPIEDRRDALPRVFIVSRGCAGTRETMQWPMSHAFPCSAGFLARERLPIRHYPHRDPVQLSRRCRLRAIMMPTGKSGPLDLRGPSLGRAEWRKFITPDNLPELCHWQPGSELPEVHFTNHLRAPHIRIVQRFVHGLCLPI